MGADDGVFQADAGVVSWVGRRRLAVSRPAALAAGLVVAPLVFTGDAVSVTVHLDPGAIGQEVFGFFAGLHLRAIPSAIASEGQGRRCLGCDRKWGAFLAAWHKRCGISISFLRALNACFRRRCFGSAIARLFQPLLPFCVQLFNRRGWSCLASGAGTALIHHRSLDDAFVDRCRGLKRRGCRQDGDDQGEDRQLEHG